MHVYHSDETAPVINVIRGTHGCFYSNGISGDSSGWSRTLYAQITADQLSSSMYTSPQVYVTVRDKEDPWLVLQQVTDGTNDFGYTTGSPCNE